MAVPFTSAVTRKTCISWSKVGSRLLRRTTAVIHKVSVPGVLGEHRREIARPAQLSAHRSRWPNGFKSSNPWPRTTEQTNSKLLNWIKYPVLPFFGNVIDIVTLARGSLNYVDLCPIIMPLRKSLQGNGPELMRSSVETPRRVRGRAITRSWKLEVIWPLHLRVNDFLTPVRGLFATEPSSLGKFQKSLDSEPLQE